MCASSCAITASICCSSMPVSALMGSRTIGRNHPRTAGASRRWHSQYRMTRSSPILRCRAMHLSCSSCPIGLISFRRILSINSKPPAVLKLKTRTPRNHNSTSQSMAVGCALRDAAAGAPETAATTACCAAFPANGKEPCAPDRTAGMVSRCSHTKVITGEAIISASVPTASATANNAASAAPCQMKCSRVHPSTLISSGEIQCAKFVIAFSLRTHPAGGAVRPVLSWTFAGLPAHESSIRSRSPRKPGVARRPRAAASSPPPADKLRRRGHAALRFCVQFLLPSLFAGVSGAWCIQATFARAAPRKPRAPWKGLASTRREVFRAPKPSVSVEFPGSCGEANTKTFVLSTKIFVVLSAPRYGLSPRFVLYRLQHQRESVLGIPDDYNLGIRARCQFLRGFDALPFEQLRADPRGHDLLEVRDALRFDALAFRLLLLFLQNEAHPKRVLLGLLLGLDRAFEHRRQLHVAQKHVFDDHAARRELRLQLILNLLLHQFTRIGVQCIRRMRRRGGAYCCPQCRLHNLLRVIIADGLVNVRGLVLVQPEKQRSVQRKNESFIRRNVGALFHRLRLNGKFLHGFQRIDQMDPFGQSFSGHAPEQRQHSYVSGWNRSRARHQQDDHQHHNRYLQ